MTESALISASTTQEQKKLPTVCQQEQTEESVQENQKVPAYLNRKKVDKVDVKVARTIMARDCRGFGTGFETSNGVIERGR